MITGPWFITPHAVRRYIERVEPGATYEQALARLVEWSRVARPNKWIGNILQFRGPRPLRCRLRVAFGNAGAPQLLTVLKGHDE